MKTSIFVLFSLIFSVNGFGQSYLINFNSPTDLIEIDTTNPNNIWQIGRPRKSYINSAFSADNAIITDTLNSYPTNDTSSFILKVPEYLLTKYSSGFSTGHMGLGFYTKYQFDSLNDFGRIEFSSDSGNTWHIMDKDYIDTTFLAWNPVWNVWTNGMSGWSFQDKSFYTGQSAGWELQAINLLVCSVAHPKRQDSTTIIGCRPQSLWLKFVFISDSIPDNFDGWAIDNILFYEVIYAGIADAKNDNIKIIPNPFSNQLTFSLADNNELTTVYLFNCLGELVLQQTFTNSTTINTVQMQGGIYFYELKNNNGILKTGKVIKY